MFSHRIEAKYSSIFVAYTIELMMDRVLLLCIVIKYSHIQFVMFSHSKKKKFKEQLSPELSCHCSNRNK